MSVFRNLMAVGVSGAITFANVGQGGAVPSPVESQDNLSNSTSVELAGFKQNPAKTETVTSTDEPEPDQAASSGGGSSSTASAQQLPELTFKQNPTKTQAANVALRKPTQQTQSRLSSLFSQDEATSAPATVEIQIKQNLTSKAVQPPATEALPVEKSQTVSQQIPEQSHLQLEATPYKQNATKPQAEASEQPTLNEFPAPQRKVSATAVSVPVQIPVALDIAPPTAEAGLSFSTPITNNTTNSPIPAAPSQVAQVSEPGIQIPDLTPPTTPFPLPVPNGTLQTNPPEIVLPSANPLYFPTTPDQVEIKETVPLTLQQAVDLAIRNNEDIGVAQLQVEQALAQLREAQAALYPSLAFSSSLARIETATETLSSRARNRQLRVAKQNGDPGAAETPFSVPFGTVVFDNSIELRYDFGLNGERGARIRSSEDLLRIRELRLEISLEDVRFDVTRAYYDLQEADANVEIQRAAVRNSQKSLEDAEALERAGVGTRFEVLQARVTLANAQQDLTNSLRDQRRARRELAALLNVDENINLVTAEPISLAGAWDMTLEETIVMAYQNRAELQEQLLERNRGEQLRREALSANRPNLTANASYTVQGRITDDPSYQAVRGWADGYQVGLQLNWNFFDGGAGKARARQRTLDVAIAEERFDQTRNQIRLQVERAFYDLQASFENIGTANLGVEEATEALRLARLRFQAGVGTQLEVINQETDLTRAQNRLLNAIIGYNRALSDLQRSVSNLPGSILYDYPLE